MIVNEFLSSTVKVGTDPKAIYVMDRVLGKKVAFPFDIHCSTTPVATIFHVFFHISSLRMLVIYKDYNGHEYNYNCGLMRFRMTDDKPIPAAYWLSNMEKILKDIDSSFKEQYAAYLIDQIINSPESGQV